MECKYNPNGAQPSFPAVVQPDMELVIQPDTAPVFMCGYEFLNVALRERLPTCWSNDVGKAESITLESPTSPKYTGVAYGGKYREASVRTEIRIPPKLAAYYYEVTIANPGQDKCIAIGFGRKRNDMDSLPGWQASDRAFHFDDGRFFHGDYKKGEQYHNGSPIEDGAVYGCGVDFRTNLMFFTKNGVVIALEPPIRKMSYGLGHLYPVVGICGANTQLDTNFGQEPFMFDFKSYYKRGYLNMQYRKKPTKKRISTPAENPGPSKTPRRNLSVTLPNLDESLDADDSDHVPRDRNDVKPVIRITLDNIQQNQIGRDTTLTQSEHSQINTSNVADSTDPDPNLPHCEADEAELDDVEVVGEIVNNAGSRANNQAQVKNEVRTVKPEILEANESNGQSDELDIDEVLDQIRRGNAQEAEAKIMASEFGRIFESKPELVLFLKIEVLVELWMGNEETDADERKILDLGKLIASVAYGLSNLGPRIQKKVEDSLLLSYSARSQVLEKHKYLLLPEEHRKVAGLIGMAFHAYKAEKDYQNSMRSI
ncbi:SPRY domain-containing protein [Ditylenchus destructor]|uniref:SPRY domain-containing protein n=1 Tax=Ditylenchus destructor TaxID=166010 RepID=A0AAD4MXP4_9BILA|nr:SPRY domain-containing protein [Ditylenchus destructor]